MQERPIMHQQAEVERDLSGHTIMTDELLLQWYRDRYSTSQHLLTLYSIGSGLRAKSIVEIGFGRSTFVLARLAYEGGGELVTCDRRDFSYLLSPEEKQVTRFVNGDSDEVWNMPELRQRGIDFAFLDYFSDPNLEKRFVYREIDVCLSLMKTNGVIALHDTFSDEYVGLQKAMKKLKRRRNLEVMTLPYNYGLGLIRYTGPSKYGRLEETFLKKDDPALP